MELKEVHNRLIVIRALLDENVGKGKQMLTDLIKRIDLEVYK